MGLVDKAIDAMTNYTETKEKVKDFSSAGVNAIQGRIKGCASVPKCIENMDVYFVINQTYNSAVVNGYMMNECENIVKHFTGDFNYVIFLPRDYANTGIKPIASGPKMHEKYAGKTMGEIALLRKSNDYTYIVCERDVLYLGLRLNTIGCGKVYTYSEIMNIVSDYMEASDHQHFDESVAIHQAFVDIAISLTK